MYVLFVTIVFWERAKVHFEQKTVFNLKKSPLFSGLFKCSFFNILEIFIVILNCLIRVRILRDLEKVLKFRSQYFV